MSEDISKQTLREIFLLLRKHFKDYVSISHSQNEKVIKMGQRGQKVLKTTNSSCCPTCTRPYSYTGREKQESISLKESSKDVEENINTSTMVIREHEDIPTRSSSNVSDNMLNKTAPDVECNEDYVFNRNDSNESNYYQLSEKEKLEIVSGNNYLKEENLSLMRECIDLKLKMRLVELELKDLQRDKPDDEDVCRHLDKIDDILTKVLHSQTMAENLCDKLCEGLDAVHKTNSELPAELKGFCDRIRKTVGHEYRAIGTELGLDRTTLNEIENNFEEEDRLHQIVFKWSTSKDMPSVHDLVAACHNVNPNIIKCRPLSNAKVRILERHYSFLYDEMHEIAVLPHLVSSGVMTLKLSQYVLKAPTKDQRIYRLITVICTRQNGFDKLCDALALSKQQHVLDVLKESEMASTECSDATEDYSEEKTTPLKLPTDGMPLNIPLRRRKFSSLNDLDIDDKCSEASFASSPPNLDSNIILKKIADIIFQAFLSRQ